MSITVLEEPQELQPVHNPYIYVLDSTNKGKDKFEYVVKLAVDGQSNIVSTLKIQSNPQGFGIVDLSKHLQNYVSFDLPKTSIFYEAVNSYIYEEIQVAERYVKTYNSNLVDNNGKAQYNINNHNLSVGDFVTVTESDTYPSYNGVQEVISVEDVDNFTTDKDYVGTTGLPKVVRTDGAATTQQFNNYGGAYAINNVVKHNAVWDWTDYYLGSDGKFLTNLPYNSIIRMEDNVIFNIRESDTAKNLKVITSNGRSINIQNTPSFKIRAVGVGANNINAATGTSFIDEDVDWYTVELLNDAQATISEVKRFTLDHTCKGEGATTLTYLNTGGSWSVFHFMGERTKTVSNKKTKYRKNVGSYDGVSTWGYSKSDRGTTTIYNDVKEVHTINTKYLRPSEGDLIEDLINSPEVFEVVNNELLAIDINTNSIKIKKKSIDKLISYSLQFEYANKNLAQ